MCLLINTNIPCLWWVFDRDAIVSSRRLAHSAPAMRHIRCIALVIYYPHTNRFAAHKWLIVTLDDRNGGHSDDDESDGKIEWKNHNHKNASHLKSGRQLSH